MEVLEAVEVVVLLGTTAQNLSAVAVFHPPFPSRSQDIQSAGVAVVAEEAADQEIQSAEAEVRPSGAVGIAGAVAGIAVAAVAGMAAVAVETVGFLLGIQFA